MKNDVQILEEAYEKVLNESQPIRGIKDIRSSHFTKDFPEKSKFKVGDIVKLRRLDYATATPAHKRYGTGAKGKIVGMQQHTGAGATTSYSKARGTNRYYVQFEDGNVMPLASQMIIPVNEVEPPVDQKIVDRIAQSKQEDEIRTKLVQDLKGYTDHIIEDLRKNYVGGDENRLREAILRLASNLRYSVGGQ
jgi:hypothetical protein